jgi:choline dehydrogenase-like flavoprotein
MTDIVIGSGPTGVVAASRLIERGRRVLMIDAGKTLEPEAERLRAALDKDRAHWRSADIEALKRARAAKRTEGMAPYGSDFHMRDDDGALGPYPDWLALRPSFALGGLSNGWGASFAPYLASDIYDWPFPPSALAPHYAYVARLAPVAGETDSLASLFDLAPIEFSHALPPSPQAREIAERAQRYGDALERDGVRIGRARNAVAKGCIACSLCLHGCPHRLIFNTASLIAEMQSHPQFAYKSGRRAMAFADLGDRVAISLGEGAGRETIEGDRLYVAAGVLSTAQLVIASRGGSDVLRLRDSRQFFTPFLHGFSVAEDPARADRHALAEMFVEILSPGARSAHAQLYTYNDMFKADLERNYGRLPFASAWLGAVARRLVVAQTFLHSDHAPSILISMTGGEMRYELDATPFDHAAANDARRRLSRALGKLGLHAVGHATRHSGPGASFHTGASLPMKKTPTRLETDIWGRLGGEGRVHIVDASSLPAIPATTITYSAMANASRIAAQEF